MIEIRPATPTDRPGIVALLNASDLPLEGLDEALEAAVVARRGDTLIACAALELCGDAALLRSVAVAPDHRGEGLGQKITEGALAVARQRACGASTCSPRRPTASFPGSASAGLRGIRWSRRPGSRWSSGRCVRSRRW